VITADAPARWRSDDDPSIAIVAAIARRTNTHAVILCGSRATGEARPDSDYDVLAVMPLLAIPLRLAHLDAAARELESVLGLPVSINPLPSFRLRHPGRTLLVWKALTEGAVLAGDASRGRTDIPFLTAQAARSYALSGSRYLLAHVDPDALPSGWGTERVAADVRKALLHAAQLQLLARGRYASSIADAARQLDAGEALELERLAAHANAMSTWRRAAELLRPWVGRHDEQPRSRMADLQYLTLEAISRRRPHPFVLVADRSVRVRLADAVQLLVRSVRSDGSVDRGYIAAADATLPLHMRAGDASFASIRDAVEREWPLADPLVGL
jgi:predicted nucleotidyltransferase